MIDVELVPIPVETAPESGMSTVGKVILITVIGLVVAGAAVGLAVGLSGDGLQPESPLVVRL